MIAWQSIEYFDLNADRCLFKCESKELVGRNLFEIGTHGWTENGVHHFLNDAGVEIYPTYWFCLDDLDCDPYSDAMRVVTDRLSEDEDMYKAWVANIAMCVQDQWYWATRGSCFKRFLYYITPKSLIHKVSNKAARGFLDNLI